MVVEPHMCAVLLDLTSTFMEVLLHTYQASLPSNTDIHFALEIWYPYMRAARPS